MGASACALSSPPRSWRWRSRSSSSLLREGERFTLALDRPWRARVWSPRACAQWSCNFLPLFACVLRQSPCQHPLAAGSVCPAPNDTWHSELCPRVPDVVRGARVDPCQQLLHPLPGPRCLAGTRCWGPFASLPTCSRPQIAGSKSSTILLQSSTKYFKAPPGAIPQRFPRTP